jgi:two-component system, chemotaxis family, sensor kinase CheA
MADELSKDPALLQDFLNESDELLAQLDQDLVALESAPDDIELLNRIFRAFHTIKGTSGFMGLPQVVELTHHTEDVLNAMRKGECKVNRRAMDVFLNSLDQLRRMLADVRHGQQRTYEFGELLGSLRQVMQPPAPDRPMLGEILVAEGVITHAERRAALEDAAASKLKLGEVLIQKNLVTPGQIQEALSKQESSANFKETPRTVRVGVEKLDDLVNLAGELVLERNRISQLAHEVASRALLPDDLERSLMDFSRRLSFLTDELQATSLKTRMVPVDAVFRKFPRMIRDLSHSLGKEVALVIRGEETEVDRAIVEEIADPLIHLIRNSIDHGIEAPAAREAAGKPRKGTLRLEARAQGETIVIQIADDGAGVNPQRVGSKAVERGMITADRLRTLRPAEILDLIFLPGFSTAERPTEVSGRGVGMDVVRTNLKKLNGTIDLQSEVGRGTTITLKLPLTLAILPVLLVRISGQTYALPLRSVTEILRAEPSQLHISDSVEMLHIRDQVIPLGRMRKLLRLDGAAPGAREQLRVVVMAAGDRKLALVVDDFVGQEETVIKPLGPKLRRVPGISGGTISGQGAVRLILDPGGIAEMVAFQQA